MAFWLTTIIYYPKRTTLESSGSTTPTNSGKCAHLVYKKIGQGLGQQAAWNPKRGRNPQRCSLNFHVILEDPRGSGVLVLFVFVCVGLG